ncbi:wax ester/triacylglycerol synthase family O-acyltransferase [Geodermatophilus sp. SYSU D00710]
MDRLTAQDRMGLWPDELGWPLDIGAVAVLDGARLLDADDRLRLDAVREAVARRLPGVPRLRRTLLTPRWFLGGPLWVDAPRFALADHVHEVGLPPPGGERQLLDAVEELRARPFDRSRPLWQMWFLTGLPQRRVGVYVRVHHAIADGVAGVATLGALFDAVPDPPSPPAVAWTTAQPPPAGELLRDHLRRRGRTVRRALRGAAHPVATARRVRGAWPAAMAGILGERAPRSSLNRPIGGHRRLVVVRAGLDTARQVAHHHGGTVNDVLLTAVAGGLRELLLSRGEPVDGLVLRAFVPVSLHTEGVGRPQGNRDGVMAVPLPVGEPDPVRRLELIAADTRARKQRTRSPGLNALPVDFLQRAAWRMATRQRAYNLSVTNVPGPPRRLFLAGAPLLELIPVVPIGGNLTLGVGALSYAGQLSLVAVADRDTCPDVEVFAHGVRTALQDLATSVTPPLVPPLRDRGDRAPEQAAGPRVALSPGRSSPPPDR